MWYIIIIIVALYLVYRFSVAYLFPSFAKRNLEKYKERFFEENPHISSQKYNQKMLKEIENDYIIDKRRKYK